MLKTSACDRGELGSRNRGKIWSRVLAGRWTLLTDARWGSSHEAPPRESWTSLCQRNAKPKELQKCHSGKANSKYNCSTRFTSHRYSIALAADNSH